MELIGLCLLMAMISGLIIIWIFSNRGAINLEEYNSKVSNNSIREDDKIIEEIENAYVEKKNQLDRLVDDSIICKHLLLQKSNSLRRKSDELCKVKNRLEETQHGININKIESNNTLLTEIRRLGAIIEDKDRVILTFQSREEEFNDDSYMQISKDQFYQIEKKLKEHKSRVDMLENENSKLLALSRLQKEPRLLEDMKLYLSSIKDFGIANFKERAKA